MASVVGIMMCHVQYSRVGFQCLEDYPMGKF